MKKIYIILIYLLGLICQVVHAQGGDNCAAALASPITIPTTLTGQTTNGYANDYSGITGCSVSTSYQNEADRLYAFIPSCNGNVTITMNVTAACGGWVTWGAIFLFQNCPNTGTCIASGTSNPNPVTITAPVVAGNTYYIWVDSWTCGATGWINYNLSISYSPSSGFTSPTSDNGYWISYASGGTNYNHYASVTNIPNTTTLEVDDITGFNACDYIMIVQMKGASVDLTSGPTYGSVTNLNLAGRYEFNRIKQINITTACGYEFILENPLTLSFNRDNIVQVIRVPYVTNLVLNSNYTVTPFDGRKGGIMVLYAQNSITFNNATIDVQGRGYRGGNSIGPGWTCSSVPIPPPYFLAGPSQLPAGAKGESFASFPAGHELARGAMANAGGAGLNVNGGGAGGSNGGTGGVGGGDWISCSPRNDGLGGGIPGYTIAATTNRILMGGGGGSGHAGDNVSNGGDGGSGGGAVWIFTNDLIVTGTNTINAAGANASNISGQWAGGGGGAGGTVQITSNTISGSGTLNINTSGGRGGDAHWPNQLGPGGGGGGGRLILSYATIPTQINYTSTGGAVGVYCGPCTSPYYNTAGAPGAVTTNMAIAAPPFPISCTPLPVQNNILLIGKCEANKHILQWQVQDINQSKFFEIEFSDGDSPFNFLSTISSNYNQNYEYVHTPHKDKLTYRIKQINKDGNVTYSNIITLYSQELQPYLTMSGSWVSVKNYAQFVEIYTLHGQLLNRYEQNPLHIDVSQFNTTAPLIIRIKNQHWIVKP
ncbi:MAG: hypothetical protein NZ455_15715 [Bacteroidia bacterium]|nr:hypothetical protein [Bacteroidia bacterium]